MAHDTPPRADRIRVLIADDHHVLRRGLKELFGDSDDCQVVGEAKSGAEVVAVLEHLECDVIVLDVTMPDVRGFDLIERVHLCYPRIPIIVLSMHPVEQLGVGALRAGAAGYLTKESPPDELLRAVRHVAAGGRYVSPRLAEQLAAEAAAPRPPPAAHEGLSPRELEVLTLVGKGERVKDIAEKLGLSEKTVSTYRTRMLEKLMLRSTAELIRYAIENDIAPKVRSK
jgi:two-component system, NarL family, invasion response regulator UvrY